MSFRPRSPDSVAECLHFVVEDDVWDNASCTFERWRRCLLCGIRYNRTKVLLEPLREWIRSRHRVGPLLPGDDDEEDEEWNGR